MASPVGEFGGYPIMKTTDKGEPGLRAVVDGDLCEWEEGKHYQGWVTIQYSAEARQQWDDYWRTYDPRQDRALVTAVKDIQKQRAAEEEQQKVENLYYH